jgi:zinc D-Ala-D-Ala dipeptidase
MKAKEYLKMYNKDLSNQLKEILTRKNEDVIPEKELNLMWIEECGEPLVPISDYVVNAVISMRDTRVRFAGETLYLRETTAEQLAKVAKQVEPNILKIYDGFRPIEYQQYRYNLILQEQIEKNPGWTTEQIDNQMFLKVFPPSWDPQRPPAHSTGGAIDLSLVDANGNDLDMGSRWGDFDSQLVSANTKGLSLEQRSNREFLFTTMGMNGFINFPGEWWHFSFGDREWVAYSGFDVPTIYGRAQDPYSRR